MYLLVWGNNIYGHNTDENNPDSMENMSVGTFMQKKLSHVKVTHHLQ